jgi:DNA-binding GntR family transcriptional regulator
LSEIEMANKFNVSRTPIREGCNRLLKEDLLQSIPYKGYIVSPVNLQDLHELYQLRLVLEPFAAELAARNPSPRFIEKLRNRLHEASQQPGTTFTQFVEADLDFHNLLAQGCGNRRLGRVISDLRYQIERLIYLLYENYGPYHEISFDDHTEVVQAVEDRNGDLAGELVSSHIENYKVRALQALASERLA